MIGLAVVIGGIACVLASVALDVWVHARAQRRPWWKRG